MTLIRGDAVDVTLGRGRTSPDVGLTVVTTALVVAVTAYVAAFSWTMQTQSYDAWAPFLIAPVLLGLSLPVLRRYAARMGDVRLGRLLVLALVLKLAAGPLRYYVAIHVYGGNADSPFYSQRAAALAHAFRHGDFSVLGGQSIVGTRFIDVVTGLLYTITGTTMIGAFLVFSWLGFWGLFFFYRAFRLAVPDGDHRRYALLVFFLPSLLYWPSALGKDAWMTLALGLAAYGAALLLTRARGAWLVLALGMAGILMVRPHVAVLMTAGLALAYLLRGLRGAASVRLGRVRTVMGLAVIVVGFVFVLGQAKQFLGVDKVDSTSITAQLQDVQERTAEGGSAFANTGGPSLVHMPSNLITVLFRPFPFEAHNAQMLLAAAEGSLLMLFALFSLTRLRALGRGLRDQPYLVHCLAYTFAFCFAFSTFNNFGILTRERVMVIPFFLALLSLRPVTRAIGTTTSSSDLQRV